MELAGRLARGLAPGDWVLLKGPLGAGKTVFVRGLARALGLDEDRVHSPTFTLVTEYGRPARLAHVDLYRIESPAELDELGLDELAENGAIVAVEWGERLPAGAASRAWRVAIEVEDSGARVITIGRAEPGRGDQSIW
jgi:tRNA threonylcarbamoyl adenosine modification protein YjeE